MADKRSLDVSFEEAAEIYKTSAQFMAQVLMNCLLLHTETAGGDRQKSFEAMTQVIRQVARNPSFHGWPDTHVEFITEFIKKMTDEVIATAGSELKLRGVGNESNQSASPKTENLRPSITAWVRDKEKPPH